MKKTSPKITSLPTDEALPHFDARRWLERLGNTPDAVSQGMETLWAYNFDAAVEELLGGLALDERSPFPERRAWTKLLWVLHRIPQGARASTKEERFRPQVALALGLAARSETPAALHIRGLKNLSIPMGSPWWLTDSLETFENLIGLECNAPWHPQAVFPKRLLCLPHAHSVELPNAHLGDARLDSATWNLPKVTRLELAHNDLSQLPSAVPSLATLQNLSLAGNPIRDLPDTLADLPKLRVLDLRGTEIRTLPPRLAARTDLRVYRS